MTQARTFIDALGRKVDIPSAPQRIVSTVPSTTEFLFDLGVGDKVVGRTRFCRYPTHEVRKIPNIGGPKELHMDKIHLLNPDLILANEEENSKEEIELLAQHFPVYVCKIRTLEDALENIWITGEIMAEEENARSIIKSIQEGFSKLSPLSSQLRTTYLIWRDPFMIAGQDTFINEMMHRCGLINICPDPKSRYPQLSAQQLQELDPQLVLLSSEPYPFAHKHIKEISKLLPKAEIKLVDGEMFAWYESHLLKATPYFEELLKQLRDN